MNETSFSATERTVVWQTLNTEADCRYCTAAHTGIAKMEKVADDVIETGRAQGNYDDPKLEALRTFALEVVRERGWAGDAAVQAFVDAGYTRQQVLEVVLVAGHKVLSN